MSLPEQRTVRKAFSGRMRGTDRARRKVEGGEMEEEEWRKRHLRNRKEKGDVVVGKEKEKEEERESMELFFCEIHDFLTGKKDGREHNNRRHPGEEVDDTNFFNLPVAFHLYLLSYHLCLLVRATSYD